MPAGKHKGVRVALSVPPGIYNQLDQWSDLEGRPVASLCMSLVEQGLRQAVSEGVAPSLAQTRINDPLVNTKPGVSGHRMTEEEVKNMDMSGFVKITQDDLDNRKPMDEKQMKAMYEMADKADNADLSKKEQQKALLQLLESLKNK